MKFAMEEKGFSFKETLLYITEDIVKGATHHNSQLEEILTLSSGQSSTIIYSDEFKQKNW